MKRLIGWLGVVVLVAFSQDTQERFRARSAESEKAGLAEPFRGVTAKGKVEPGLFPVRSSDLAKSGGGVSGRIDRGTAREDEVSGGRSGVAQMDESALLHPAGREFPGDE